ncbi:hypothetical protein JCM11641_003918 [Rhodosporidiobolus odoratus]
MLKCLATSSPLSVSQVTRRLLGLTPLARFQCGTRPFSTIQSTESIDDEALPLPPLPRRPFNPQYRIPSSGHFTSLHSYYLTARQPLYSLTGRPEHQGEDASAAELKFSVTHTSIAKSLTLPPPSPNHNWRSDVQGVVETSIEQLGGKSDETKKAEVRETTRRLLDGKWLSTRGGNTVPNAVALLRGLRSRGTLSTLEYGRTNPFDELLRLVQLTLEMREIEAAHDSHSLLDPTARSLLAAIEDYFGVVGRLASTLPVSSLNRGTSQVRAKNGTIKANPEQEAIIRSSRTPGLTRVIAGAGTGKTTAMLGYAQRVEGEKEQNLSAVKVFMRSKRLKGELAELFPTGTCLTMAAAVKRSLELRYQDQFWKKWREDDGGGSRLRSLRHREVMVLLEIPKRGREVWNGRKEEMDQLSGKRIAERVLKGFDAFLYSADALPSSAHLASSRLKEPFLPDDQLLPLVQKLWDRVSDLDDAEAPLPFDAQAKLVQLDPGWRMPGWGPILVDEAQDLTPCELELVTREQTRRRVVLLGDANQAIDGWRDADDRWTRLQTDSDFNLVFTYRFGSNVAAIANARLPVAADDGKNRLVGNSSKTTPVYRQSVIQENLGRVRMYPRYLGILLDLYQTMSSPNPPRSFRLLSSEYTKSENLFRYFRHGYHLYHDFGFLDPRSRDSASFHSALRQFQTWRAFEAEVESWGSDLPRGSHPFDTWRAVRRMADEGVFDRKNCLRILDEMERRKVPDGEAAEVTYTVPHQAKGLEFPHAVVDPSFYQANLQRDERRNLLHVANTRASQSLEVPDHKLQEVALTYSLHNFYLTDPRPPFPYTACRSLTSGPLIAIQTPFPYHPSHCPPQSSRSSKCYNPDDLLDAAQQDYTSLSRQYFPICLECAKKAIYPPLKQFAHFAQTRPFVSTGGAEPVEVSGDRFNGFTEQAELAARLEGMWQTAGEEVKLERF